MGKITTTIVISVLVIFSLFGAICIFAGVYAYNNPSYHWVDTYYHGLYLPTLEKDSPEVAFSVMGVGFAFFGPSVTSLGAYIYSKIKESKKSSKTKAKFGSYFPLVEFMLGQYKKRNFGNPEDVLETRLKAKIASGKTEKEAIQELYEEAKSQKV